MAVVRRRLVAVCERSGFWRYFIQDLVEAIKAVPELITSPGLESAIGIGFTLGSLFYAIFPAPEWSEFTRIALAFLSVPSFIIYKHGTYREEGNC